MEQTNRKLSEEQKRSVFQLLNESKDKFEECFLELAKAEDEESRRKFIDTRIELSKMLIPTPCEDIELRKWCIEQCSRVGSPNIPKADELYIYIMSGTVPAQTGDEERKAFHNFRTDGNDEYVWLLREGDMLPEKKWTLSLSRSYLRQLRDSGLLFETEEEARQASERVRALVQPSTESPQQSQ